MNNVIQVILEYNHVIQLRNCLWCELVRHKGTKSVLFLASPCMWAFVTMGQKLLFRNCEWSGRNSWTGRIINLMIEQTQFHDPIIRQKVDLIRKYEIMQIGTLRQLRLDKQDSKKWRTKNQKTEFKIAPWWSNKIWLLVKIFRPVFKNFLLSPLSTEISYKENCDSNSQFKKLRKSKVRKLILVLRIIW